jgi:hypothetical protein
MKFLLSFHATGDCYKPSTIPFAFARQNDVGDIATIGRFRGQPAPYGSPEVEVSDNLPWAEKIPTLVATVLPLLPKMKEAGADDFYVSAGYFYGTQCNLEFSSKELALLASLDCPFCPSCYGGDEDELASDLGKE